MSARRLPVLVAATAMVLGGVLVACGSGERGAPEPVLSAAGAQGKVVAQAQGCFSCHTTDGGRGTGPTWLDLAGSERTLEGGEVVVADDAYLERAILDPRAQVAEGYANIMPVYKTQMSDEELAQVIAYLRDLSSLTRAEPEGR
jgi:cytochrome c oxidase subunit II